ncbi:2OG-Fe dioxygenase family protein [Saccharopolyspora indica]|uniref:2OG-Fe dioxygenase family protein n=1 Tax=Saccharopolyspora indica TaxID=1229659 RepID=UPI0022EA204F|nr:2OG-Fe dioxygenase family protein [Saccharopolyspora indica]MDA3650036.1 2OG-Fe dioxygenase family protein [Saccharopolyspora indica]
MSAFGVATGGLTEKDRDRFADLTVRDGYTVMRREDLRPLMTGEDFRSLRRAWNDLCLDTELADGGTYRYRRYGRLAVEVTEQGVQFAPLPHATFRQDVIPLWQGKDRSFAPISEEVLLGAGMRALVGLDAQLASAVSGRTSWTVGIHLIRVIAPLGAVGKPTPEGRHRDGHLFVGMHLLRRDDCDGGLSTVYPERREPVSLTLTDPLDSMFVDDNRVMHEVSPTRAAEVVDGIRDMLLVDLNAPGAE